MRSPFSGQAVCRAAIFLFILAIFQSPASAYRLTGRWSTTATDGSGIVQGDPVTLTWGFVADGTGTTANSGGGVSNLISFMDTTFGAGPGGNDLTQRPWFTYFEQSFERWSQLAGLSYAYEPNDDGVTQSSGANRGILGTRADVRIAGKSIDGPFNVLAFNYFPNNGDMTLDTDDGSYFSNAASNHVRLRNTIMHEHGHGIGLSHVISSNTRQLMEPSISSQFDGPQFDDILGAQRGYGDVYEKSNGGAGNDTAALATPLGIVGVGELVELGTDAVNSIVTTSEFDFVSIDDNSDTDFYSFTIDQAATVDLTLTPMGPTYQEGPQNGTQSPLVTSELSNLNVALFDTNGTTLLAADDSGGLGQVDTISDFSLSSPGQYFARIKGAANNVQMYKLGVSVAEAVAPIDGDFNDDGFYDCADIDALVNDIAGAGTPAEFDLSGDGNVDGDDLILWLAEGGAANLASGNPYLFGDASLDGVVDVSDFNLWNGSKFSSATGWCAGDFTADGFIDVSDFNLWNGGKFTASDAASPNLVPEPNSCVMLLFCFGWLQMMTGRLARDAAVPALDRNPSLANAF